ncbi:MAG: RNA polymerase sigma factor [Planctomycetes bacterium]|nr:RNA polymerase sigma factor [Planctomycetota bacterium]MCP4770174.1 RNA polymerase sigma factor [Planctomycetota bacterium]MCP4860678.1 RNA polymerase sigma factor [Planctomycetota bacterium]
MRVGSLKVEATSTLTAADFLPLTHANANRFVETFSLQISGQVARFRLPPDITQDVVQETLIRALRGLPNFRGDSKLSTWLYRISYREGLRAVERWKRHRDRNRPLNPEIDFRSDEADASEVVGVQDDVLKVRKAMEQLPDNQRLALGYHYLDGLGVAEIAELMGSTANTIKSWLKRGRDRLRELTEIEV